MFIAHTGNAAGPTVHTVVSDFSGLSGVHRLINYGRDRVFTVCVCVIACVCVRVRAHVYVRACVCAFVSARVRVRVSGCETACRRGAFRRLPYLKRVPAHC